MQNRNVFTQIFHQMLCLHVVFNTNKIMFVIFIPNEHLHLFKVIMCCNMSKIHQIIDIIGRFEAPNRSANGEPNKVLIVSRECMKVDVIYVSVAQNSCNLTMSRTRPRLTCFIVDMKQNYMYVLKLYTSKTFLDVNIHVHMYECMLFDL